MEKLSKFIINPKKSLISLSIPVMIAAVVEVLYNIIDAIFVGRIGTHALAAISFSFPFFFILVALSLGLNTGMSSRISRFIGEKKKKEAENTALHGLLLAFITSILTMALFLPFLKVFFMLQGASGDALTMSIQYMDIILYGVIFLFMSYTITSVFSAQGDTKTAMKIDIYSLALNAILTPIFIFIFHLGISGAALGTVLSLVFALIQSLYFLKKNSYLRLNISSFRFSHKILKEIILIGIPSTFMLLVISFYVIFLNRAFSHFGVLYVAAFGIVSRLEGIATLPIYGLSVGAMTLAGMFYGAKKYKLLKEISWYAIKLSALITSVIGVIFLIVPSLFLRIFTNDSNLINIGIPYFRLDVLTFPLMAVVMITSRILQGMGDGVPGLILNIIRVIIVAVPTAYIFVFLFGLGYLYIAFAMILGGIVASIVSLIWLNKKI